MAAFGKQAKFDPVEQAKLQGARPAPPVPAAYRPPPAPPLPEHPTTTGAPPCSAMRYRVIKARHCSLRGQMLYFPEGYEVLVENYGQDGIHRLISAGLELEPLADR